MSRLNARLEKLEGGAQTGRCITMYAKEEDDVALVLERHGRSPRTVVGQSRREGCSPCVGLLFLTS